LRKGLHTSGKDSLTGGPFPSAAGMLQEGVRVVVEMVEIFFHASSQRR
jgi:hypothetical protein